MFELIRCYVNFETLFGGYIIWSNWYTDLMGLTEVVFALGIILKKNTLGVCVRRTKSRELISK